MAQVVQIHVDDKKVRDLLNDKLSKKLPAQIGKAGFEFCEDASRELRIELRNVSITFNNKIYNSIRASRHGNFSTVKMAQEGIWLDRMEPHHVALKRGRLITKWAMQARIKPWIKQKAKTGGSIYVRPHPFFNSAYQRSLRRLKAIMKRGVNKALRG